MDGRQLLGWSVVAGLILSFTLGIIGAERRTLKNQLVGTWTLVDWDEVYTNGSQAQRVNGGPAGVHVFGPDGRFFALLARPDSAEYPAANRLHTLVDDKPVIDGSVAYFGTYKVNNVERSVDLFIEVSTTPNEQGRQKRLITTVTADELKYAAPTAGGESTLVFKRAY
jgi:hypothetical protein